MCASGCRPCASLPVTDEVPAIAVRCCPALFKPRRADAAKSLVRLPHRVLFAVASLNSVSLYDTEQRCPIAVVGNLHLDKLTDVAWCVSCAR